MPALLTEPSIDNRQSSIDNPQWDRAIIALLTQPSIAEAARACGLGESTLHRWLRQPDFAHAYSQARRQAFSVALGSLQHLSEQAVQTLQSLMQDAQVSPTVRLSAARTVLQMSFKAAQQFTLQSRLDQLEAATTALDTDPPSQYSQDRPHPQSKIENRKSKITPIPLKPSHSDPNSSHPRSNSEQDEQSPADNGSNEGSVQSTRCWWRPGKIRHSVARKRAEAPKHSNPLSAPHLPAKVPPLPPSLGGRGGAEGSGG